MFTLSIHHVLGELCTMIVGTLHLMHINRNTYRKVYPAPWASNIICFKDDNGKVGGDDNLWSTVTLGINWFDMRGHEMIYTQGMQ